MYMPNLMPRDVHRLWLSDESSTASAKQPMRGLRDDEHDTSTYAPPLSSYSSERPGPILGVADEKLRQLKAIRTLGYTYLTPLGVGKTMQTLIEEGEMRRQMEEQFQAESATAENLMGEVEQQQQMQQQQQVPDVVEPEQPVEQQEQRQEQPPELPPVDLDDEIPDAEDVGYGDYDEDNDAGNTLERQYDRGFMITEQYEAEEETDQDQQQVQFATPVRELSHVRHLAHSGSMGSIATGGTTWESSFEGNVSMNASDLDMTIDD